MWWLVLLGACLGGLLGYFGGPAVLTAFGAEEAYSSNVSVPTALLGVVLGAAIGAVIGGAGVSAGEWADRPPRKKARTAGLILGSPVLAAVFSLGFVLSAILLMPNATGPFFELVAVAQTVLTPFAAIVGAAAGGLWSGGRIGRRVAAALAAGLFAFGTYAALMGLASEFINAYMLEYLE